jgi:hypothetical protein
VASGDASFARGAFIEGDLEGILLAYTRFGKRDEIAVVTSEVRLAIMLLREISHWRVETLLVIEEVVDERAFWSKGWHENFN